MPRLYVGNLPYTATEQEIKDAFEEMGVQVSNVHLPKDRETGQARGFGFVEVSSDPQAAITILNNNRVLGRVLRVDIAQERQPRPPGGGAPGGSSSPTGRGGHWDDRRRRD